MPTIEAAFRHRVAFLLFVCSFVGIALACNDSPARPHVVLISVDTLRADHVGAWGYERATTPTLDTLASRSVRFSNAISHASWTLPSHMSMMTSLRPSVHGVSTRRSLAPEAITLAETLKSVGYQTAAFVSWVYVGKSFGFGQGFDSFRTLIRPGRVEMGAGGGAHSASQIVDVVVDWLDHGPVDPLFLFVHLFDPHSDYDPPREYSEMFDPDYAGSLDGRFDTLTKFNRYLDAPAQDLPRRDLEHIEALYDAEIRYVDDQLARLLQALDEQLGLDNCLIVFTSDHGEEFMDHGSMEGHGWSLYEEVLHVPLLVKLPNAEWAGSVVTNPVGLIDIAPTILNWIGVDPPAAFEGTSLAGLIVGRDETHTPQYVLSENDRWNIKRRSIRGSRYKLIITEDTGVNTAGVPVRAGIELFDLREDAGEQQNLYEPEDPRSQALVSLLEKMSASPASPSNNPEVEISPEQTELLRSLGYVE